MKKYLAIALAAILTVSCSTVTTKTARTESVPYSMYNATVADLKVGERVVYTMTPSKEIRRGGIVNCKKAAIQECLTANGNADILLEPEFVVTHRSFPFFKVKSVTVSGRPATYVKFRSLNDTVWVDPVFRGTKETKTVFSKGGKLFKLFNK